jgi:hypothetical protein
MANQDEFANAVEAGTPQSATENVLEAIDLDELRLADNKKYQTITGECQTIHKTLLDYEKSGKLGNYVENPSLIGDYLGKLRLNANQLFAFMNIYIDILNDLEIAYAKKRQEMYEYQLNQPKGSPSSAEKHAREFTRVDEAKIKNIENTIQQIKNEYERYNGICMYLQSRMKEFNTERMVG